MTKRGKTNLLNNRKYFINPGSVTGAYSATNSNPRPSFILLGVQGDDILAFIYEMVEGESEPNI